MNCKCGGELKPTPHIVGYYTCTKCRNVYHENALNKQSLED